MPPTISATSLPAWSPSMTVWPAPAYLRTLLEPVEQEADLDRHRGDDADVGRDRRGRRRPASRVLDRSCAGASRQLNCHLIILSVSPSLLLTPSAADVSKPECIMQCSHRGSLP